MTAAVGRPAATRRERRATRSPTAYQGTAMHTVVVVISAGMHRLRTVPSPIAGTISAADTDDVEGPETTRSGLRALVVR